MFTIWQRVARRSIKQAHNGKRMRQRFGFIPRCEELEGRWLPSVSLAIASPQPIQQGSSGTTNLLFSVTRSGDQAPEVKVDYNTANGTAVAGTDYTATSGTLDFQPNQTTATISVPVLGSTLAQPNRTFTVQLSNARLVSSGPLFGAQQTFTPGTTPEQVAVADFNGDGKVDLAVANYTFSTQSPNGPGTVSVFTNSTTTGSGTVSFASQQTFATGVNPFGLAVADFNGDGKPDLVATNSNWNGASQISPSTVSVLMNTTPTGASTASFASQQTFGVGANPGGVAVADFNGDGKPDIAVVNESSNTLSVLLNTTLTGSATASFAPQQTFPTGHFPDTVTVADLNGDGKPDIIVGNENDDTVTVFMNTTARGASSVTFAAPQTITVGTTSLSTVVVGDFTGDGKPDLAVTNTRSDNVAVLVNTTPTGAASASFGTPQTFATGAFPRGLVAGDFSGDGKLDLAAAAGYPDTISVLVNTTPAGATTPTFATRQDFPVGQFPSFLAVGDFNTDGSPDLAVVNQDNGNVGVLLSGGMESVGISSATGTGTILANNNPATLTALAGTTPQTVAVAESFVPLAVVVKNAAGNPVQGASVTFTAPASGAGGMFSNGQTTITGTSDANGDVSEIFTANQSVGSYSVTAAAATGTTATFQLTNSSITLSTLAGASPQTAPLGTACAPLTVVARDAAGNLVSGITITFTAPASGAGGTFSNGQATTTATTDINGQASASLNANQTTGSYTVTAVGGGGSASFQLNNEPLFPTAPTLSGPGTSSQHRPTFTWTGIWGAVRYELWLSNSQGEVLDPSNLTDNSFVPASDLAYDNYTAWVRAFDGAGNRSVWSSALSFQLFDPNVAVLSGPSGTISDTQPTLSWTTVASATSYELYLANATTGQYPYLDPTGITGNSYSPSAPLVPGTYTAWVRAQTANGPLPWSDPLTFTEAAPPPPIVSRPGGGGEAMAAQLSFSWSAVQSAAGYELWVNDLSTGQSKAIYQSNVSGTSYTVAGTTALGTYEIWLRSYNAAGQAGTWSAGQVFTVRNLLTPALNATGGEVPTQTPTFTWDAVAGATSYEVWVNDSNGQMVLDQPNVIGTSFTPTKPLPLGTYTAWVRAYAITAAPLITQGTRDASAPEQSQWSTPWNFALVQLTTPQLTAPASPTTTTSPTLTWTAASDGVAADQGAIQYALWVDNLTNSQSKFVYQTNLKTTSFTPTVPLRPGTYEAWVQASFGGKVSAWSSSYLFTVALPQPPLLGLAGLASAPMISWNTVLGATQYEVWIGTALNLVQVQDVKLLGTSLPTQGLLTKGNYSVWVRAINDAGLAGAWSEELDFTMPG
jgi:hypothetical protein